MALQKDIEIGLELNTRRLQCPGYGRAPDVFDYTDNAKSALLRAKRDRFLKEGCFQFATRIGIPEWICHSF
jgi:hypothetical protein